MRTRAAQPHLRLQASFFLLVLFIQPFVLVLRLDNEELSPQGSSRPSYGRRVAMCTSGDVGHIVGPSG